MTYAAVIAVGLAVAHSAGAAQETYRSAVVDTSGRLIITTSANHRRVVARRKDQTIFADPVISPDGTAVGAQAEYPYCSCSYDIPMELVVYSNGRIHRFAGIGLPIFKWQFADGGKCVAYEQQTVHFACSIHYELRNIASERLLDSADLPEGCGQEPNPDMNVRIPAWVAKLRSVKKD